MEMLFVHGTGVRKEGYDRSFVQIVAAMASLLPEVDVKPCRWYEVGGVKLNADGASIPLYNHALGIDGDDGHVAAPVSPTDVEVTLWSLLYTDPLYELRLLALQGELTDELPPNQIPPGTLLDQRARSLAPEGELWAALSAAGVEATFAQARDAVLASEACQNALRTAGVAVGGHRMALARAIVATAMAVAAPKDEPVMIPSASATARDAAVDALARSLGGELAFADWVGRQLWGLAQRLGVMNAVERRRNAISDAAAPAAGDILHYQANGEETRGYIHRTILEAKAPVVLLCHSLGGIAAVDLLIDQALPQVQLLVTVGSQAPLLYEMDALHSLRYGYPLPEHFPQWLNLYDARDLLSYIGATVFPAPNKIQDFQIDSRQPFPQSHSAYWTNPATWKAIQRKLRP